MANEDDKRNFLITQLIDISEHLKEGRYKEIDLTLIEKEATELAANFGEVITSLESVGYNLSEETDDVQQISTHLKHISKSTEEGVMQVMDHSESIVSDANCISDNLAIIKEKIGEKPEIKSQLDEVDSTLAHLQSNAFKIITSLEFEDINRQKLEKILKKLHHVYDNLIKVLLLLKVKERIDKKDSDFIKEIKHISDPEDKNPQKQGMIDELLKEFGL